MIQIRSEVPSDHDRVHEIHRAAFGRSNEAELVSELRSCSSPQISLVAEADGEVVGHIFFSPVAVDSQSAAAVAAGLAPVSVVPAAQGQGVGSALIRAGLARCPTVGWRAVFVLGDPSYYSRFGFVLAAPLGFRYESEAFDAAFQVLELEEGVLSGCRGRVRYHPAFGEV